jgi:putative pyruvate formate lyase activating enzyme
MGDIRTILSDYFQILEEGRIAKYKLCKDMPVSFNKPDSLEKLWKIHGKALEKQKISDIKPRLSLLDLKAELASRIFHNCCFCERRCGVDRSIKTGECGVGKPIISSEFLHIGEERVLVPSHTIFFSGCTFHCVFCQNWDISQVSSGIFVKPEKLVEIIQKRRAQGGINVNWVGGDPTPNLAYIIKVLKLCNENIPQIWNSNMYCSNETMKLLNGIIDLYLTDFKYGNDGCAKRLSKVDNYYEIVKRNHKIAYENGDMIIRHLVMPNHINCCSKPILNWIAENIPNSVVNIMAQYRPEYHAFDYKDISEHVSIEDVMEVRDYADDLGLHLI